MKMRQLVLLSCVVVAHAALGATGLWRSYTMAGTGENDSFANGVNNAGQIVGVVHSDQGVQSSFVTDHGRLLLLDDLGGGGGNANAINDFGTVVGTAATREGRWHAFTLQKDGSLADLGTLGGPGSSARAVNNRGQVIGYSDTSDGKWSGFLYEDGKMTNLGTLGGRFSAPMAINMSGTIVGLSERGDGNKHAFLYSKEKGMVDLGTLGGRHSVATGINDAGLVVGTSETADHHWHAFTYDGKRMTDLGQAIGDGNSYASTVNNLGTVVGIYVDGLRRTFVYDDGTITVLDAEHGLYRPMAMNDHGLVVGQRYALSHMRASFIVPNGSVLPDWSTRTKMIVLAALLLFLVAVEVRRQRNLMG